MRLLSIVMLLMNIPALVLLWPVYVGMNALMFSQLEPYEIQLPTFAKMALGIPGIWIGLAGGAMGAALVAVQLLVAEKRVATAVIRASTPLRSRRARRASFTVPTAI